MTKGRLIAVVGPSGVGKDSVMAGLCASDPSLALVRRTITRAPDLGGEDYDAVTVPEFETRVAAGDFAVHWGAHGLFYGIPNTVKSDLEKGQDCLANFSRGSLLSGQGVFDRFVVLNITATPERLAERLRARGRETEEQIQKRLSAASKPLPEGLNVIQVPNDGPLDQTIANALGHLRALNAA